MFPTASVTLNDEMASTKQKQQLHKATFFQGFCIDVERSVRSPLDVSKQIPPSIDKVREINSNLTCDRGFMSSCLSSPSGTLSSEMPLCVGSTGRLPR